jgi:hypothetical protein
MNTQFEVIGADISPKANFTLLTRNSISLNDQVQNEVHLLI